MPESIGIKIEKSPEEIVQGLNEKLDTEQVLSPSDLSNYAEVIMSAPQVINEPASDKSWHFADLYCKEYGIQNNSVTFKLIDSALTPLQTRIEEMNSYQQLSFGTNLRTMREKHINSLQNTYSEISRIKGKTV
jgi:Tol biopolymer transport system component